MASNFLKKYLPLTVQPKPIASFTKQKITIPKKDSFLGKMLRMKQAHTYSLNNENNHIPILQILTDFDYTLTKHSKQENVSLKLCDTIFGSFVSAPDLPEQFKKELINNYNIYGPYETDGTITFSQRATLVNELYRIQLKLFKKHKINLKMLEHVAENSNIIFRAGTDQLFNHIKRLDIPIYIISGGISDMIDCFIKGLPCANYEQSFINNISIHSNQLEIWQPHLNKLKQFLLNQQNPNQIQKNIDFVKFKKNIIHSYNKYLVMESLPVYPPWRIHQQPKFEPHPSNCFLLGDLISDIYMSRAHPHSIIISIFYAKQGQTDQRALAQQKFDIIVQGDGSHKVVIEMLKIVHGQRQFVDWNYLREANKQIEQYLRWI